MGLFDLFSPSSSSSSSTTTNSYNQTTSAALTNSTNSLALSGTSFQGANVGYSQNSDNTTYADTYALGANSSANGASLPQTTGAGGLDLTPYIPYIIVGFLLWLFFYHRSKK
jgi:hypothetical protein